jgi:hypothetical protein
MRWLLLLLLLAALSACGDYPEPFMGNPGGAAMRLRQPPDPRLAIPTPGNALLSDAASRVFAAALASRLQAAQVPAYAEPPEATDWRLVITAQNRGQAVIPLYTVLNPQGQKQGATEGQPISAADWANADPATLNKAVADAAPSIDEMLTAIETGLMKANPNSLYNRAAFVDVPAVTGAPGDGDLSLAREMRAKLAALGPKVETTAAGADFTVRGEVRLVPIPGNQQRVEIQWIITDDRGREAGRVVQLNDIPAHSLDHYWGDVALVVAEQASAGVNEVIRRRAGHTPRAVSAAGVSTAPKTP